MSCCESFSLTVLIFYVAFWHFLLYLHQLLHTRVLELVRRISQEMKWDVFVSRGKKMSSIPKYKITTITAATWVTLWVIHGLEGEKMVHSFWLANKSNKHKLRVSTVESLSCVFVIVHNCEDAFLCCCVCEHKKNHQNIIAILNQTSFFPLGP